MIDKATAAKINRECIEAIEAVAARYGCKLLKSSCRYDDDLVRIRVEMRTNDAKPEHERDWERLHTLYGFKADDLGKPFTIRGTEYTIAGIHARARKTPLVGRRADGKMFKFDAKTVLYQISGAVTDVARADRLREATR